MRARPQDWFLCFESLEQELRPYLGASELADALRRTGRCLGGEARRSGPGTADPADWGLPLEATRNGFELRAAAAASPALAAWCAGFAEAGLGDGRRLSVQPAGGSTFALRWEEAPCDPLPPPRIDFAGEGPLTPYQFAQVLDLSADAILFVDAGLRFRAWNRGATEMFGYAAGEALGAHYELLVPEDLRAAGEMERINAETERAGTLRNYRTRRVGKDGREIAVVLTRTAVHDARGGLAGFAVILRDVTELQQLEDRLAATRHLATVGELAAQIAHEVRNPLASVHGALQVLRRRMQPDPPEAEVFEDVGREIERLDRLVTDLLRFGRPTPPNLEHVDLGEWIEDWARGMQREARERSVELEVEVRARPFVMLDGVHLEQVLRNLLENAIEAEPEDCHVKLSLELAGPAVRIVFQDSGPGVPTELRGEVLKPFFTTKTRGSGLGLAICQRHLAAMGGSLELATPPRGAAFLITLPAIRAS